MTLRMMFILVALLLFAGCRDAITSRTANETRSTSESKDASVLSVGDTVAGLNVPVLLQADDKHSISFDALHGSVVVLEFWATWCGPCVAAIDHLNDLADQFADQENVRFISVTDEKLETITEFVGRKPIHTWIGLDEQQSLLKAFGISGIPQTIVINSDGKVAAKISPSRLDAELLKRIQNGEMLEEESSGSVIVAGVDPTVGEATAPVIQLVLRESTSPSAGQSAAVSGSTATLLGYTAKSLILQAFGLRSTRTEFGAELPDIRYDLITRFPKSTDDERQFVQSAIGSAFDIRLRQERRNVEVLLVGLGEDGGHSLSDTASTGGSSTSVNQTGISVVNGSLSKILNYVEGKINRPILDETGLNGSYDLVVTWGKDATTEQMAQAFTEATGLILTNAQREIEFAVVENR
jgi:uncharacterized protein (TIGR03435 family)